MSVLFIEIVLKQPTNKNRLINKPSIKKSKKKRNVFSSLMLVMNKLAKLINTSYLFL